MIELKLRRGTAKFYDSVDELPMLQLHLFNNHIMQDSGMGSDMQGFDNRINGLIQFVVAGKQAESIQELTNLRMGVFYMLQDVSLKSISAACVLHSINGQEASIETDEELQATAKQLEKTGITAKQVREVLDAVRKKWIAS